MADKKKKNIIGFFLIPASIFIAPGVLFMFYKLGEALMASIILTIDKGEIGPLCFMLAVPGLILGFIGMMLWVDDDDNAFDMGWY